MTLRSAILAVGLIVSTFAAVAPAEAQRHGRYERHHRYDRPRHYGQRRHYDHRRHFDQHPRHWRQR